MSIVIRMSRLGRTNRAHFRLGVYPKRSRRDGPAIELLGHYDPQAKEEAQKASFNAERIQYWAGLGAEVTPAVRVFLNKAGVKLPARKSNKPNARAARRAAGKPGRVPRAANPAAKPMRSTKPKVKAEKKKPGASA
jgi:small subunit ribosomal protein S16